jgi:CRP/FNR family transcriptional regulator
MLDRDRTLGVVGPGGLCGERALVAESRYGCSAVALEDGLAAAVDRAGIEAAFESGRLTGEVVVGLMRRLASLEDQVEVLLTEGSRPRVVAALTKLAGRARHDADGPLLLSTSPTELAAWVGLDVETVKETVRELRDRGYLSIARAELEVVDPSGLLELLELLALRGRIAPEPVVRETR